MLTLSVRCARLSVYLSVCVCVLSSVCVCLCVAVCLCPFRLPPSLCRRLVMYQQLKIFSFFLFFCVLFATFSFCSLHFALNFHFYLFAHIWFAASAARGGGRKRDLGQAAPVGPRCLWCFLYALFCLPCGAYWSRRRALRTGVASDYP